MKIEDRALFASVLACIRFGVPLAKAFQRQPRNNPSRRDKWSVRRGMMYRELVRSGYRVIDVAAAFGRNPAVVSRSETGNSRWAVRKEREGV